MTRNNELRVLLISPIPPPVGGDSTWAMHLINYFKLNGYPISLINTSMIGKRTKTVSDSIILFDEVVRCFKIWINLKRALNLHQTDIVHMNTNCSPRGLLRDLISAKIISHYKIPYIVHCHCNVSDQIKNSKLGMACFKKITTNSCKTLVLNRESLAYVQAVKNNAFLLPNFIQKERISCCRTANEHIKNIVFIGHVKRTKGINEFLETAKHFPQYEFRIVGPLTPDYTQESILAESVGNVEVVGPVNDNEVNKYLDGADVFFFPTYTEGFSISLLEAMARGLPVITTDVGANRDMIEEWGGLIVPKCSVECFIKAIDALASQEIRQKMSDWNISKVRECYTITKVISLLRKLYEELINEKID